MGELPGKKGKGGYTAGSTSKRSNSRKGLILALRMTVFTLLILSIAGFGIKKSSGSATSIFVVDGSDSTARLKSAVEEFVGDAVRNKKNSDKVGIVHFGTNAAIDSTPTDKPFFSAIQSKINGNFTNIEQGLKLAASLIPGGDRKRVVLVTDGMENAGEALKQARLLKQQNITVDVFPVKSAEGAEVQVKEIVVPESLHKNERFDIGVKIQGTVKTKAVLKLYSDKELTAEKNVELQPGENNFVFADVAEKGGMVTYSAVIEPDEDSIIKNNSMSAFSYVEDTARILLVQDADEAGAELVKILGTSANVTVSKPDNLPLVIEELQRYDAFVISNVAADRLDDRFLNNLEICIKHQGKGLLVTGGENSYAPGGYFKTPLEKVLPVNMDIKPKEEAPNLGLVLVIDKSGSMSEGPYGVAKVDLAKEAAIRSTEVMKEDDMIGVIGFDAAVQWVVKTQKLDNLKKIQDAIGTIRADGGTQILPPLEEAYLSLKDADTKLKHIILLTDGEAEKTGYEPIIENIREAGITLSTVAVGRMADVQLLGALANGGGGRFYMTDEFTDIPKIFAKETFLAGKTYLNNRTFIPSLQSYSDILKDIQAIPSLDGYVGTTPKSTAKVIFQSDREEPVLATWQYGLGRTAAWTSDARGIWTSKWQQWEQAPRFWNNLVSWLLQKKTQEDYSIKGAVAAGTGVVELKLPPEDGREGEKVEAAMVSPSGAEQGIVLEPVSPGTYRGTFNGEETGVYIANISVKNGEDIAKSISAGIVIPYSPEYDISQKDPAAFLEKLAYEGGGRILKNAKEVFTGELAPVVSITDMTPFLLALAILLFLLDIAVRRLNITLGKISLGIQKAADMSAKAAGTVLKPVLERVSLARSKMGAAQRKGQAESSMEGTPEIAMQQDANRKAVKNSDTQPPTGSHISTLLEKKKKREK